MLDTISISLSVDTSELERDIERIENGELEIPTVSAILVRCDGIFEEEMVIWLPEE
ncbi:MAG: hypothetical protein ACYCOU_01860 [Sulfobacillus sp.]